MRKICIVLVALFLLAGCTNVDTSSSTRKVINNQNSKTVATNISTSSQTVTYYFARQTPNVDQHLIAVINNSKSTLDIAIYSLTKQSIVNAIISAKDRGINVEIITDAKEAKSKAESKQLERLKSNNIPIKINTHSGLMHLKMTVTDDTVTTGSYNYTQAATNENDEVLVVIKDSNIANEWKAEFSSMWNDTTNYTSSY